MSEVIKYCKQCAITGNNLKGSPNRRNIEFGKGYLVSWGNVKECPYCHSNVETINMSTEDYLVLRDISNYNRQLLEAMIDLHDKDIIEYELKMSQFRNQAEQQKSAQSVHSQQKSNLPKCPTCSSTDIKKIGTGERMGSVMMFGIMSKKINKTWKCNNCGCTW